VAEIVVRTMTEADIPAADAIGMAAYGRESRRAELARLLRSRPDGWLLAEVEGEPAGMVGATDFGPFAYVGQMGVLPAFQRRGIARALMERLLAWIDERGCPVTLLDASDAGYPLYAGMGFMVDDGVALLARVGAPTVDASAPGRARVDVMRLGDLAEVIAFDTPRFGADRGAVLAAYLADGVGRAFVARGERGEVRAFLFAQARMLGPWVAVTPEDAEAVLAHALALPFAGGPLVIAPEANGAALALLARYGFAAQRTLRHMRRGGGPLLERRMHLYGQASFAIG